MYPERGQARRGTGRSLGPSKGRVRTLESWEWESWPMKESEVVGLDMAPTSSRREDWWVSKPWLPPLHSGDDNVNDSSGTSCHMRMQPRVGS